MTMTIVINCGVSKNEIIIIIIIIILMGINRKC